MNLFKKLFSKKEKINIGLTFQVEKNEIDSAKYQDYTKLNCFELLQKYNYDLLKDSKAKKLEYIKNEITNSVSNLMIFNIELELEEVLKLHKNTYSNNLSISQILVPNITKRNKKLQEGIEMYRNHNRWIDFYPGQVEDIHNNFEKFIEELKNNFKETETKIIEI